MFGAPPGLGTDDDAEPVAKLGSGVPPSRRRMQEKSIFDVPDEGALQRQGEETIQKVSAAVEYLRTEGWDLRCGASVLGDVGSVFPSFGQSLEAHWGA